MDGRGSREVIYKDGNFPKGWLLKWVSRCQRLSTEWLHLKQEKKRRLCKCWLYIEPPSYLVNNLDNLQNLVTSSMTNLVIPSISHRLVTFCHILWWCTHSVTKISDKYCHHKSSLNTTGITYQSSALLFQPHTSVASAPFYTDCKWWCPRVKIVQNWPEIHPFCAIQSAKWDDDRQVCGGITNKGGGHRARFSQQKFESSSASSHTLFYAGFSHCTAML